MKKENLKEFVLLVKKMPKFNNNDNSYNKERSDDKTIYWWCINCKPSEIIITNDKYLLFRQKEHNFSNILWKLTIIHSK